MDEPTWRSFAARTEAIRQRVAKAAPITIAEWGRITVRRVEVRRRARRRR